MAQFIFCSKMVSNGQSSSFNINMFFWKIFGLWPGREPSKYYKYYSFIYLTFTLVIYLILLILNLLFMPRKIVILIKEGIFFFTEIAVAFKVIMILKKRDRILEVFDYLDCDKFEGKDHVGINIIDKNISKYKTLWKVIAFISNIAFVLQCFVPIILYLIGRKNVELPVSQYYFLSEDLRSDYYLVLALYQNLGIYGHMTYNVNIDTFIAGMIIMTIAQLKVLKHKFSTMELDQAKINFSENISKLNQILRHYESIIEYSNIVQDIISLTMFVQFCMGTCIICVVALLMVCWNC
ncbi:unnamed protein product [Chilo suppressalis]|uniref:Odorant receptor n=1 Tax=Chilo suppressalis TaxID=168631 RepID=A0ABN8L9P8_CHISP|nr:unnamed protein product [Chilo suppressalis]